VFDADDLQWLLLSRAPDFKGGNSAVFPSWSSIVTLSMSPRPQLDMFPASASLIALQQNTEEGEKGCRLLIGA
jgi:hypothetical protein